MPAPPVPSPLFQTFWVFSCKKKVPVATASKRTPRIYPCSARDPCDAPSHGLCAAFACAHPQRYGLQGLGGRCRLGFSRGGVTRVCNCHWHSDVKSSSLRQLDRAMARAMARARAMGSPGHSHAAVGVVCQREEWPTDGSNQRSPGRRRRRQWATESSHKHKRHQEIGLTGPLHPPFPSSHRHEFSRKAPPRAPSSWRRLLSPEVKVPVAAVPVLVVACILCLSPPGMEVSCVPICHRGP